MAFKPTFEMMILTSRIADGDTAAIGELWPLVMDTAFDPTRPVEDIANDLVSRLNLLTQEDESAKPSEESNEEPDGKGDWDDALVLVGGLALLVGAAIISRLKRK